MAQGQSATQRAQQYELLAVAFRQENKPVRVSFRELVPDMANDRGLSLLHSYPAKVIRQIPSFLLGIPQLTGGGVVLDPFCGSGTVLLEAQLAGQHVVGADSNPLARLISSVKTTWISPSRLRDGLRRLEARIPETATIQEPDIINVDYWFYPHVRRDLLRILQAVEATRAEDLRNFFKVTFSQCVRRLSLADPRVPVPVRLRPARFPAQHPMRQRLESHLRRLKVVNVLGAFRKEVERTTKALCALKPVSSQTRCHISVDARKLLLPSGRRRHKESVDLVITSPPYGGAQKYIRSCSLSLTWLGMCTPTELRHLEDENIGREHYPQREYSEQLLTNINGADTLLSKVRKKNPLRAHIASTYLVEMRDALTEVERVMRPGAHLALVLGNNTVNGFHFDSNKYLTHVLEELGLVREVVLVDEIRSRGLMTKRNATGGIIKSEQVSVFRKASN